MPLLAGSVTVTGGVGSGTGLAKELYDARRTSYEITEEPTMQDALDAIAKDCNVVASTVIAHFKANALIIAEPTLKVPLGIPVSCPPPSGAGATTEDGTATGTVTSTLS